MSNFEGFLLGGFIVCFVGVIGLMIDNMQLGWRIDEIERQAGIARERRK